MTIKHYPQADVKGKQQAVVNYQEIKREWWFQQRCQKLARTWLKSDAGFLKLNVNRQGTGVLAWSCGMIPDQF
jgi:hypothetical protein